MQTLFVPIERRDGQPHADVHGVLQHREFPAASSFLRAAAREDEVDNRCQEREPGAREEHERGPYFCVFGPCGQQPLGGVLGFGREGFGGFVFEEDKDHDGEHDYAEQGAGEFGRDLEDAEPPFHGF